MWVAQVWSWGVEDNIIVNAEAIKELRNQRTKWNDGSSNDECTKLEQFYIENARNNEWNGNCFH